MSAQKTMKQKVILDACCGSKMMWFDKENPNVLFADIRQESHILCDGRQLTIDPDIISDYTKMSFEDETFYHVVFDPSHLINVGDKSWMKLKYGALPKEWQKNIYDGFNECFRVLKKNGTLNFKWNEDQILVSEIIKCIGIQPLYGHKSGKNSKTHWLTFVK